MSRLIVLLPGRLDPGVFLREFDNFDDVAALAGVSRRTVERWAQDGIPRDRADHVACKVFNQPTKFLWPEALSGSYPGSDD
jgi:hypothetical protein